MKTRYVILKIRERKDVECERRNLSVKSSGKDGKWKDYGEIKGGDGSAISNAGLPRKKEFQKGRGKIAEELRCTYL